MQNDKVTILGISADRITHEKALEKIKLFLSSGKNNHIVTLNSEMIVCAQKDPAFREIIENSDLAVADGMGVLQAASFLDKKTGNFLPDLVNLALINLYSIFSPEKIKNILPEKISGVDMVVEICGSDFATGKKVYLLGAGKGIAQKAAGVLEKKFSHIKIVGAEEGFFSHPSFEENEEIVRRINLKKPDILFVALGAPKQEKWIHENLKKIPSVRLAMGVGGAFDIISGKLKRAPTIFQSRGLEWLWRLLLQPSRIGRIYNATLKFAWLIFRSKEDMIRK